MHIQKDVCLVILNKMNILFYNLEGRHVTIIA